MPHWVQGIITLAVVFFACVAFGSVAAVSMAMVKLIVVFFVINVGGRAMVNYANRLPY